MSRIALGTVQFGLPYGIANREGQVSRAIAKEMLDIAQFSGIDTIDTAIAYGESENCLGAIGADRFRIVTKLPAIPENCINIESWITEQFNASRARLKVSRVFGLLLHRPMQLLDVGGDVIYRTLIGLKNAGYVEKIGISIYSSSELDGIYSHFKIDLVQAPFNLVDRGLLESGWMARLKADGVEIHTRSAFLQGLLLMPREAIPTKFSQWSVLWDAWHDWLSTQTLAPVQACLSYILSFPEIDRVVVGADSMKQLREIVSAELPVFPSNFPDIRCTSECLINPANWSKL